MEEKLIILCFYIGVQGLTRQQADQQIFYLMEEYRDMSKTTPPGYHIEQIWLPIQGDSKVECIYPIEYNEEKTKKIIDDCQEFLKNSNKNSGLHYHNKSILRFFKLGKILKK